LVEIESILAIALIRRIKARLDDDVTSIKTSARRWKEWRSLVPVHGFPVGTNEFGELLFANWDRVPRDRRYELPDRESWITFSQAVMPVLEDYYQFFFKPVPLPLNRPRLWQDNLAKMNAGKVTEAKRLQRALRLAGQALRGLYKNLVKAREAYQALQVALIPHEGASEEARMSGGNPSSSGPVETRDGGEKEEVPSPIPQPVFGDPVAIRDAIEVWKKAGALLETLVRGLEDGSPIPDSMGKVEEILDLRSKIPRLETLESLQSLIPERTPKASFDGDR
jgi:hypothetical protein